MGIRLFFIIILITSSIYAGQTSIGGTALLMQPVGARQVAMGESFISVGDDVDTIYYNPAGLVKIQKGWSTSYVKGFADTYYGFGGYGAKWGNNANFCLGFGTFQGGLIEVPVSDTENQLVNSQQDYLVTFSYAAGIGNSLSYGINVKNLTSTLLNEYSASILMGDFGILFSLPAGVSIGAVVQNYSFGNEIKFRDTGDPLPLNVKAGMSYTYKGALNKMCLTADVQNIINGTTGINSGLEYWVQDVFALRGGYKTTGDTSYVTTGLGFYFNGIFIDYSRSFVSELDSTDQFTLRYNLKYQ